MPFPGGTYITQIRSAVIWVADELEQFYALLEGYLRVQHNEDGTHAVITADSVEASGDVTSGGDGTFDGTVTADADGTPVSLGPLGPVGEPAVQITSGTSSSWQFYATAPNRTFSLRDVLDSGHTSHINIVRTALDNYDVRPASSSLSLTLGTDASGQRWAEVNTLVVQTRAVTFPAAQVASADPNTLDDYEEGTWFPALESSGGGAANYSLQNGKYTKVGNIVHVDGRLTCTNKGTLAAGTLTLTGLPFTANATAPGSLHMPYWANMTTTLSYLAGYINTGQVAANLTYINAPATGVTALTVADIDDTVDILFSGKYLT